MGGRVGAANGQSLVRTSARSDDGINAITPAKNLEINSAPPHIPVKWCHLQSIVCAPSEPRTAILRQGKSRELDRCLSRRNLAVSPNGTAEFC